MHQIDPGLRGRILDPDARVRAREEGQVYFAEVFIIPKTGEVSAKACEELAAEIREMHWRLHDISIVPIEEIVDVKEKGGE